MENKVSNRDVHIIEVETGPSEYDRMIRLFANLYLKSMSEADGADHQLEIAK